jgi:peptide/nickel transport system permease protein
VAIFIIMAAIIPPWVAKVDPEEQNFDLLESPPSVQAWFGTDRFGRNIYSRVVFGARISLVVASISMATAMFFGGSLSLLSGYIGGWDLLINRLLDVFFAIPGLLLSIGIAAMRRPGLAGTIYAIAIVYTQPFARVMRGPAPTAADA